jgi:hypothetical protein
MVLYWVILKAHGSPSSAMQGMAGLTRIAYSSHLGVRFDRLACSPVIGPTEPGEGRPRTFSGTWHEPLDRWAAFPFLTLGPRVRPSKVATSHRNGCPDDRVCKESRGQRDGSVIGFCLRGHSSTGI